jgi:NCS1 family nucleobase:cation symporter-1
VQADLETFGGAMPKGAGDLSLETRGIAPIPETARYGTVGRVFTVWFAPNIVPAAFFLGTLAAADFIGLGWWSGLLAIVVGNVIGAALTGVLATMGPPTGTAQMPLARAAYGKSIVAPGLTNWGMTIGWDAINSVFGASALQLLVHIPFAVALIFVVIGQGLLGILGYEAIHQFEKLMSWVLGIVFVVLTIKIIGVHKTIPATAVHGADFWGSFILFTTIIASFVLAWALYASDYTRYLPRDTSPSSVFWATFGGLVLSAGWIEILGLAVATQITGTGMGDLRDLMGGGFLGVLALGAVVLGTVAVNSLNDYTGSLSLQAAGIRVPRPASAAVVAVLGFGLTLWFHSANFGGKFENYLLFISYWIAPWAAVVLIDWYRRRRRIDATRLMDFRMLPSGWQGLTALLAGFAASVPFMDASLYIGPVSRHLLHYGDIAYFVGFVVAGVVYSVLPRNPEEVASGAAATPPAEAPA